MRIKQSKEYNAIVDTTCEVFMLQRDMVLSKTKLQPYIFARQVIQYLIYRYVIGSWSEIAKAFNCTHGNIVNNFKAVDDYLSYDSWIKTKYNIIEEKLKKDKII